MRDLRHLLAQPGTPLRASDFGGNLEDLRAAINRDDPHYGYEFLDLGRSPNGAAGAGSRHDPGGATG